MRVEKQIVVLLLYIKNHTYTSYVGKKENYIFYSRIITSFPKGQSEQQFEVKCKAPTPVSLYTAKQIFSNTKVYWYAKPYSKFNA
jgi:hypothetical protein